MSHINKNDRVLSRPKAWRLLNAQSVNAFLSYKTWNFGTFTYLQGWRHYKNCLVKYHFRVSFHSFCSWEINSCHNWTQKSWMWEGRNWSQRWVTNEIYNLWRMQHPKGGKLFFNFSQNFESFAMRGCTKRCTLCLCYSSTWDSRLKVWCFVWKGSQRRREG